MSSEKKPTESHFGKDMARVASPIGTDDDAADTATHSARRDKMALKAEKKLDVDAERKVDDDEAHAQRGSSAGYGKEEHMNEELIKQKEQERIKGDPLSDGRR